MRKRTLFSAFWLLLQLSSVYSFPLRINIGALFDHSSQHAHTAFRYIIEKHNNETKTRFKLDKYEKIIPVNDSYVLNRALCSIMGKGVFNFFGTTNMSSIATIESICHKFHMPYVTPSAPLNASTSRHGFMLHVRPLYDRALLEFLIHFQWSRVSYVYDTEEGLMRLQKLYEYINRNEINMQIDATRIVDINNCYSLLRQLDGDKYIVLDFGSEQALKSVLKQIQNVGMNRASYHYLLGGLIMDELDLDDYIHGGVNITGFRLVDPDDSYVRKIQEKWSKLNPNYWKGAGTKRKIKLEAALTMDAVSVMVDGINRMLKRNPKVFQDVMRRGHIYNNGSRGISCYSDKTIPWVKGRQIMAAFKKAELKGLTGYIAFDKDGYRRDFKLDILELKLNHQPKKVGNWSSSGGLKIARKVREKTADVINSANRTRIITTIKSDPFMMLKKATDDGGPLVGNDRYEGYCVDLAKKIAEIVGFDYVLREVADKKYGAPVEKNGLATGYWNGMVGELTRKEADLAIAPLTISSQRERVIDFSKPFMSLGISIMIKEPEKQKPGVFSFLDPLSYEIWMFIIFAYLGVSIVLFLVSRFSPYEWQIEDSADGPSFTNDFTILNSMWFSLGSLLQQGCELSPRSMSGRIVGSVWWFFTLIMISSYTANLAAFLTVERMLTPIESADDLAKQTAIQYGTLNSGSTKAFFQLSKIAVYHRMWEYMVEAKPSVFVNTTNNGVERVRTSKGKYAFLLESTMNDYYNQRKPCNTMKVGGNLDSKGYGVATPLHSELREPVSLAVLTLRESGELQKLFKKWWYDKGECGGEGEGKGSSQSALTLSNVAGIFYILIGGLGLSMIISLLEFLYKSQKEAKRQKKTMGNSYQRASGVDNGRMMLTGSSPDRENGGVGGNAVHRRSTSDLDCVTQKYMPPSSGPYGGRSMPALDWRPPPSPAHAPPYAPAYTYTAPAQVVSLDGYTEGPNTHTQV